MKRQHPKLRIETLEDRSCPAGLALPANLTTGGGKWRLSNNAPATAPVPPAQSRGLAIVNGTISGGEAPPQTHAYNAAFQIAVNGTTFQDPTGTVDLTGTTVTSNAEVLSGLTTTVQYFFDPNSATVRAVYSFSNPSAAPISATVDWKNSLRSGGNTTIINSSNGDTTLDPSDSFFTTSDGGTGVTPIINWVRYGPGTVQTPASTPEVPGNNGGEGSNDLFTDEYDLTVPAGQTQSLMFFGQLADNAGDASEDVSEFGSVATLYDIGLLNGLSDQQEAQIVNWQFPAITSANATTFTEATPGSFTVTTTNAAGPGELTLSETGPLPSGVFFEDNEDGTATLSGTPELGTSGTYPITIQAIDGDGPSATQNFTLTVEGMATHFSVTAPANITAGSPFAFTVTALDASDNPVSNFSGTVHFTSSDAAATLPADATLTNGTGTFDATFDTAGDQSLTATDEAISISGAAAIAVDAAAASHFTVTAPLYASAGSAFNFTVTALDPFGNVATGYTGTVDFASSAAAATLPAPANLTNGTGTFSATLDTAGNQTITAADSVNATVDGTSNVITVFAAPASKFAVEAPATAVAGVSFSFQVIPEDAFGNVASFSGPVHFASTDLTGTVPPDTIMAGPGTFTATLRTAGTQTLSATSTGEQMLSGVSGPILVGAAAVTHFVVAAPAAATAGIDFNFTVRAEDAFDNTATGYAGTVHFTSSDGSAILPVDSMLSGGMGTFSATLKTAGIQTIAAADTATPSLAATSNEIAVNAGSFTHFGVVAPATAAAGAAFNFTVTAEDAFDNTITTYDDPVHFTSSDATAVLPADSTLNSGVGTFSATLTTASVQTITAQDDSNPGGIISGTSNDIAVSPAAATHFTVSAPANAGVGEAFHFTVTALDAFDNVATGYAGTVHFTSSDGSATVPADSPLAAGTATFSATLFTIGAQTISARDLENTGIAGTSNAIDVAVAETFYAVGSGPGVSPSVIVYDSKTNAIKFTLKPFEPQFLGGVHVTIGDVNGDGIEDVIVGAGPGGGPHVQVFSGATGLQLPGLIGSFFAYSASFRGGVSVAVADLSSDGFGDIVTGAGVGGGPQVTVFSGRTGAVIKSFFAFAVTFRGGVNVATGDVDGDGIPDIIAGVGPGAAPEVKVFSGTSGAAIRDEFPFEAKLEGGVNVAAGDLNGDGYADIVAGLGGVCGGAQVRAINGQNGNTLLYFFAYTPNFTAEGLNFAANVAVGDLGPNGTPEIITGSGVGGGPHVKVFDGSTAQQIDQFFPFSPDLRNGVFVGGDGK